MTSVIHSDSGNPDESPIYRHSYTVTDNGGNLISTFRCLPDATTTAALLKSVCTKYAEFKCMGEREVLPDNKLGKYVWINHTEFQEKVMNFARGLNAMGLKPGDKVGIYSVNCIWWQVTNFACHVSSLVPVPIYDSLGPGSAEYIINHSECAAVVVSQAKLPALKDCVDRCEGVSNIIIMADADKVTENNKTYQSCASIVALGKEHDCELQEPEPDDLALIMYTSGSTGNPKGCMLTHRNLIAGATGLDNLGVYLSTTDTLFSMLPLAHIYEMGVELLMFSHGVAIGFFSGSVRNLLDDLQALQPTIICGVPRVWNRIVDGMKAKIAAKPPLVQKLLNMAMSAKKKALYAGKSHSLLVDGLILRPFREALGGRVRLVVSGGAPILPEVYDFMLSGITPNVVQGYGLTEVVASVAVSAVPRLNPSGNGPVSQTANLKLRKVEGMMYDPRGEVRAGEILIQGPHIFQGYYKAEELTREVLDEDGWFATGDIGVINKDGELEIVDRVKQLVKLSQGEYVSITVLTDVYSLTPGIKNIYVYANSHHDSLMAVVVPEDKLIEEWKKSGISDFKNSRAAEEQILKKLLAQAEEKRLRGFEKIKRVLIDDQEFTVDNGLLTPSMKLQWKALMQKYEPQLLKLINE